MQLIKGGVILALCLGLWAEAARAQEISPAPRRLPTTAPPAPLQLQLPGPERLFRLESEADLQARMRREAASAPEPHQLTFPEEPVLSREPYTGRHWPPMVETVEPAYVCYGRLYFEQINAERYGWDLGPLHPLLSAGIFYFDVATLPYRLATEPCRRYECSAGYCLPGDPVPLLLYPPHLNGSGVLAEAATVGMLFVIFP